MIIQSTDIKVTFENKVKELTSSLYSDYTLSNLQSNEAVDNNFDKGFFLYYKGTLAAAACVIKNPELRVHGGSGLCISHYECINNIDVSRSLLDAITDYCKRKDVSYLVAPMNGSTWNNYRFSVDIISDSYITESYHKEYYANHFEFNGFTTLAEYVSQKDSLLSIPKIPDIVDKTILFRTLDPENYDAELSTIYEFCKNIFQNNYLYTDISLDAFLLKYKSMKNIINPQYVLIAEDNGEMVGLLLAIHDFYSINEKRLVVKTLGRKHGIRYAGVAHELSKRIIKIAQDNNYQSMIHAFMHRNNISKNVSRKFSGEMFRKYKLFYKSL